jgi:SLT domain-containing protein
MNTFPHRQLLERVDQAGFNALQVNWLIVLHDLLATNSGPHNYFELLDAALKQRQLFCQKPETLNGNVEASAALLGLSKTQFIAAALKQPSLFYQKPETLNGNVEASAALLGLSKTQFIAAALKQPPLLYQKPETLNSKKPYLLQIYEALGNKSDFASELQKLPAALCYSKQHLHARFVLAKLGPARGASSSLISLSAAKTTAAITKHFTSQIVRTGSGIRALQVMHAEGLIASLPSHIRPIQRPPRRERGAAIT